VERLAGLETCVGPVLDVGEAMDDPQVRHRGIPAMVDDEVVGPGPALKVSGHDPALRRAPDLGEHTEEVLVEAGLTRGEIDELRAAAAV
jgi:crotonobetainyl-CoA:carnitine CoA-transferase CaiB-like acyl-CoA transferase